jgi:hypothetical protein
MSCRATVTLPRPPPPLSAEAAVLHSLFTTNALWSMMKARHVWRATPIQVYGAVAMHALRCLAVSTSGYRRIIDAQSQRDVQQIHRHVTSPASHRQSQHTRKAQAHTQSGSYPHTRPLPYQLYRVDAVLSGQRRHVVVVG